VTSSPQASVTLAARVRVRTCAMWWLIVSGIIEVVAILMSVILFRRRARDAAYIMLMLAALLPTVVVSKPPSSLAALLPYSFRIAFVLGCLLLWRLTICLYFLKRPTRSQVRNLNDRA